MKDIVRPVLIVLFFSLNFTANAQFLRQSLLQYQLDALALNPAYAGSLGTPGFDATYFGNFTSSSAISRSAQVSVHGPSGLNGNAGLGGIFQFYKTYLNGEVNIKPAFSWKVELPKGNLSFGAALGINYFDFDDDGFGGSPPNFASLDGGLGIYYFTENYFAGLSALSLFEKTLFLNDDSFAAFIPRETPFSVHTGFVTRLYKEIQLKPSALVKYAELYRLPDPPQNPATNQYLWSADIQSTFIVGDTYMVSLLYGFTDFSDGNDSSRFGISATLILGNFHLGYAIQRNSVKITAVELPSTHLVNAGYRFDTNDEGIPLRYF